MKRHSNFIFFKEKVECYKKLLKEIQEAHEEKKIYYHKYIIQVWTSNVTGLCIF